MNLTTLRDGSRGDLVVTLQTFLRGTGHYEGHVDGAFGPKTAAAVKSWQHEYRLKEDAVVGNKTWAALMAAGLMIVPSDDAPDDKLGANWPPKPSGLKNLTAPQRQQIFGELVVEHDPFKGNPENCKIIRKAPAYKIVQVEVPQLRGVIGAPPDGKVLFHAKGARMLQLLFAAWEAAELLPRVRSWGGALAVRYVRGSRSTLSPHAWGSAFDINVSANPLGAQSALVGEQGSVRELVPIANDLGWWWGGHFNTREDGMHFEIAEIR